MKSFNSPSL